MCLTHLLLESRDDNFTLSKTARGAGGVKREGHCMMCGCAQQGQLHTHSQSELMI